MTESQSAFIVRRDSIFKPPAVSRDSASTLVRSSVIAPSDKVTYDKLLEDVVTAETLDYLAHCIYQGNFSELDVLVSHFNCVQQSINEEQHQRVVTRVYNEIISNLIQKNERLKIKRLNFQLCCIIYKLYLFLEQRGIVLDLDLHTLLVSKLLESQGKEMNSLSLLHKFPKKDWPNVLDMMAYYAIKDRSAEALKAESRMEDLMNELENNEKSNDIASLTPDLICQLDQLANLALQEDDSIQRSIYEKNEARHWMNVRIQFETLWRSILGQYSFHEALPFSIRKDAASLYSDLVFICNDFQQFEYGWYWFERSPIKNDWNALVAVATLCEQASQSLASQSSTWQARLWAVYRKVVTMDEKMIIGSIHYPLFMEKFMTLAVKGADPFESLPTLIKLSADVLRYCSPKYFPMNESIFSLLVKQCWKAKESKDLKPAFRQVSLLI